MELWVFAVVVAVVALLTKLVQRPPCCWKGFGGSCGGGGVFVDVLLMLLRGPPNFLETQKMKNGDFLKILKSPKMSNFSTIFENGL